MNFGVDVYVRQVTPRRYRPGIGLRPGGERADIEPLVPVFHAALYESVAAHSRLGLDVVVDVGHHDAYARPHHILADCARRLTGLPVLFVGVRCSLDEIMERRRSEAGGEYLSAPPGAPAPPQVAAWQREVHRPGLYDLEVDTSRASPGDCAAAIGRRLVEAIVPPTAFERLAAMAGATPLPIAAGAVASPPDPV